jgi:hypothetical protein
LIIGALAATGSARRFAVASAAEPVSSARRLGAAKFFMAKSFCVVMVREAET